MRFTAEQIRSEITASADFGITRALLKKRLCPPDILVKYSREGYAEKRYPEQGWKLRVVARRHHELPQKEIQRYIHWGSRNLSTLDTIADILLNPSVTTAMIEQLIDACNDEHERGKVFRLCAGHAHFPVRLYSEAVAHEVSYVRSSIARNRAISCGLILPLMHDEQYKVQVAVVSNPIVPKSEIAKLLELNKDEPLILPHPLVLRAIMDRLPDGEDFQRALSLLAQTGDAHADQTLAKYTTDIEILTAKCYDPNPMVRRMAVINPATPEEAAVAATLLGIPPLTPNTGLYPRRIRR
jgi:hypothetical protein